MDNTFIINRSQVLQLNHVLRNRLNSILGFLDILYEDNNLTVNEKKQYVNILKSLTDDIYSNLDSYEILSLDKDESVMSKNNA